MHMYYLANFTFWGDNMTIINYIARVSCEIHTNDGLTKHSNTVRTFVLL